MAKKQDQFSAEQAKAAAIVQKAAERYNLTMSQTADLQQRILDGQINLGKNAKEMGEAIGKELAIAKKMKREVEGREILEAKILANKEKQTQELEKQQKATNDVYDIANRLLDTDIKMLKHEENAFTVTVDQAAAKMDQLKTDKARVKELLESNNLTADETVTLEENLAVLENQETFYNKILEAHEKGGEAMIRMQGRMEGLNDEADKLGSTIDGVFKNLPAGGFLQKALGLDDAADKIKKGIAEGFAKANEEIAEGKSGMFGLKAGMSAFNAVVAVNPLLLVVAAGSALFGILKESEEQGRKLAETTGMDLLNSQRLVDATQARNTKAGEILASTEDLLAVQSEVISQMGPMAELSQDVASNIAETSKAFGYSAKTGGEVQTTFMQMGATAEEAAKSQQKLAADAFKAGVPVGQVMEDIAKNSRVAARYMGDSTEEITEAAIEAAKLGMGLDDLASIADGLLDIEDSLTSQFEYQALTGKEINLDKAREFALQGKLTDMAKELSKEVGDIHDFNAMTVIERDKLAKSMGMETDQLQKMLAMDKVREKVGEKLADQAAELGMDANELADLAPEELEKKIAQTRETEKMQKAMADMAEDIKSMLLPVAKAFMSVLSGVLSIVKLILIPFKFIFDVVGALVEKFPIIGMALKLIGTLMLANWLYSKYQLRNQNKSLEKRLEAMEMQKKMNKLKKFEAQQAAKTTKEEKAQTKEQKEQNDLSGKAQQQAQQKKGGGGLLGKLKNAVGFGEGGVLSKLGGAAMGMLGGGGGGGMIPGFATGGDVKSTGIAKVHAGERVIPAKKVAGSEPKGNSSNESMDYNKMGSAMATAMKSMPAPEISMDGKRVSESVTANQSFDKGFM